MKLFVFDVPLDKAAPFRVPRGQCEMDDEPPIAQNSPVGNMLLLVPPDSPPQPSNADLLRTFLAEVDVPCPVCGYSLRSLPEPRCPECGTELRLYIHPHVPFSWGFLFGVFGSVIGFVLSLGVIGLALVTPSFGTAIIAGTLGLIALVQMILWERRYHRWRAHHRGNWTLITCSTWLPAAILTAMGAWMLL